MPYRDRTRVEGWVKDYCATRAAAALDIAVLDKNFEAGPNSGIVVVTLRSASTITFLHPEIRQGSPVWTVTFEARNEPIELDAEGLQMLSEDIAAVSELRDCLQKQTDSLLQNRQPA